MDRSNGASAYERLLKAIEDGDLQPGSRLREAELADRFAISRTPIREALSRLESRGLVTHEPHRGATVTRLGYAQVTELYDLREVLEGMAARLAAVNATDALNAQDIAEPFRTARFARFAVYFLFLFYW